MWADNETEIDLLGFDYLVESLELVLTEQRLLPVTVGVMGDWGSGKSSLLSMTARRLQNREDYICVPFSPWRFEGYDDVKTALIGAVLNAVTKRLKEGDQTRWNRLKEHVAAVGQDLRTLSRLAPLAGGGVALAVGAPPEAGMAVGTALSTAAQGETQPEGSTSPGVETDPPEYTSVADFRKHFRALLGEIEEVRAVVVFVDDLDRCLPPTIVATFEAIRLFLHVPKTAYVLAAHPLIVEAAVDARYEDNREGDKNLGRDYLEKIVQVSVTVPPLAEPEVESYINLLFADLHLEEEPFGRIREAAAARRREDQFGVAMNYGIASDALNGAVPADLQTSFELANRISPTLARGLRGNPRQVKRFLNTLILRQRTAALRGVTLDDAKLAKLMVLERSLADFEKLFQWQLAQDGQPVELVQAERIAREGVTPQGTDAGVKTWSEQPHVESWLRLDPPLAGEPLGSYFFFSRDRLSPASPAARLSVSLQDLLGRLQLSVAAQRRAAVQEAAGLEPPDRNALYEALLERAEREPRSTAMSSAMELAAQERALLPAFVQLLTRVPPAGIPVSLPPQLTVAFSDRPPELDQVLDQWESAGPQRLMNAVQTARSQ